MKTMNYSMYSFLLLVFISIWGSSCKKQIANDIQSDAFGLAAGKNTDPGFADNNMVMYWNEKAATVLNGPFTPPAQERYFAMIQIAVHDALNAIKPKYESFAMNTIRSQHANADAAVAAAAYWSIKKMGLASTFPVDDWYTESLNSIPDGESKELGKTLGMQSADAIIANRANDNFEQANIQVPRPDGINPGEYKSTLPFSNPGLPKIKALHQWGLLMKPFVTESNYQFRPETPYALNTPQYLADYNEVKVKGARVNHTRTADESEIGVFWVERATIGWNRFARNVVMSKKLDAWKTARLFALLHTAMTDGTSGCFEAKYYYLYWRPETAIRLGDNDGVPATIGDATWLPSNTEGPNPLNPLMNVYTPPIPDYPSAHANFGGAAAEIIRLFLGTDNITVNQTSDALPGVTRYYSSASQAARDNSLSRIYVGYHFRKACLAGEDQGKKIAAFVFAHQFREN